MKMYAICYIHNILYRYPTIYDVYFILLLTAHYIHGNDHHTQSQTLLTKKEIDILQGVLTTLTKDKLVLTPPPP